MRHRYFPLLLVVWLGFSTLSLAQRSVSVLEQIPDDARGFVLMSGVEATTPKLDMVTARFQVPLPSLAEVMAPFSQGLDKQRSLGLAWLPAREGDDPQTELTHFVLYIPVTNYDEFLKQFGVEAGDAKITEVAVDAQSLVMAKQGEYAVIAPAADRGSITHVLNAKANISAVSRTLHAWYDQNDVSVALAPSGTKLLFAKLKEGLAQIKAGAASVPGGGAEVVEASLQMYESMFAAAEEEFTQVAIGLRVDADKSVALHSRLLLSPTGSLAKANKIQKPQKALAGVPGGPFVIAFEGVMPADWSQGMMAQSFNVLKAMQGPDADELTEAQLKQLGDIGSRSMQGVRSMAFCMGVGEAGSSMYSRTVAILHVEDSADFMKRYADAMTEMSKLMEDTKLLGEYQVEPLKIGNTEALHLTMDMSKMTFGANENIPNMKDMYEKLFGPGGKMSIYLAPANEQAVVMAYVSPENLTRTIEAFRNDAAGLAGDRELMKTGALLSDSAQWLGYASPAGIMQFTSQMATSFAPNADFAFPEFPASPPIGFAAELTSSHLDAQLVVPLETIEAIMQFVQNARQQQAP